MSFLRSSGLNAVIVIVLSLSWIIPVGASGVFVLKNIEVNSNDLLSKGDIDINFLFDVQLSIIVEVGRTKMLISDLLELEEQSIIELDSMVGQPLDIRANDLLVARGEVIVVNEKFAVRITDIISPDNRFEAL